MIEVVMPEMGESVFEGTITRWLVKVGESVERDQPIVEVSTDKVDAEIPSPAAGTLQEIRFDEGAVVQVADVLAVIATDGDRSGAGPAARDRGPARAPAVEGEAAEPLETSTEHAPSPPAVGAAGEPHVGERARLLVTPIARRIAESEGLDLARLRGSGAAGRITKEDVLTAIEERKQAPSAPRGGAAVTPAAPARGAEGELHVRPWLDGERVEIEPMSRMRKLTARHMVHSQATSVHVTTVFHVDMTRVVETRNRVKAAFERDHGTKLTFMPFIFRAIATALRAHRKFNAAVDGETIVYKQDINLGIAVALDWGLIVPVIHEADQASLAGLAKKANDLADRARAKRLRPEEIQRGTFTITNPGVFGSLFGTPIINQPQVAILCVGAIEKRPVVLTDAEGRDSLAIRHMAYFALTYDHRLIDGADAERFMRDVKATLENETWSELG